jgi:hypothetical protein
MADKELELTNTASASRSFKDAKGRNVIIKPGETRKVSVSEEMATKLSERAEAGSPLILGKPKSGGGGSKETSSSKEAPTSKPPSGGTSTRA